MRRLALALVVVVAALAAALPAPAGAAQVQAMVIGKHRVLHGPKSVRLKERSVRVSGRRCRVRARTPLSVLVAMGLRLRVRGERSCDATLLYVAAVAGERERGRGGWVYKVGRRAGSRGAGDPGVRLRDGQRVTWFWCELGAGGCQRTLEVRPARTTAAPGESLRVKVRAFDDFGRGVAVRGAAVRLGSATAVTGAGGSAVLRVGPRTGRLGLTAQKRGTVRAFPVRVRVR